MKELTLYFPDQSTTYSLHSHPLIPYNHISKTCGGGTSGPIAVSILSLTQLPDNTQLHSVYKYYEVKKKKHRSARVRRILNQRAKVNNVIRREPNTQRYVSGPLTSICFQKRAKYLLQSRCYNFDLFFTTVRKDRENNTLVPSTNTNAARDAYICIKIRSHIGPTRVARSEVLCEILIVEFSFWLPRAQCICTSWKTSTAVKQRNASC